MRKYNKEVKCPDLKIALINYELLLKIEHLVSYPLTVLCWVEKWVIAV